MAPDTRPTDSPPTCRLCGVDLHRPDEIAKRLCWEDLAHVRGLR